MCNSDCNVRKGGDLLRSPVHLAALLVVVGGASLFCDCHSYYWCYYNRCGDGKEQEISGYNWKSILAN